MVIHPIKPNSKFYSKNIFSANPISSRSSLSSLTSSRRRVRSHGEWKQPQDDWNITSIPRSVLPHLVNKNQTHTLPAPANLQYRTIDSDERLLMRFHEIKVNKIKIVENLKIKGSNPKAKKSSAKSVITFLIFFRQMQQLEHSGQRLLMTITTHHFLIKLSSF